jgi:hypothetical protein
MEEKTEYTKVFPKNKLMKDDEIAILISDDGNAYSLCEINNLAIELGFRKLIYREIFDPKPNGLNMIDVFEDENHDSLMIEYLYSQLSFTVSENELVRIEFFKIPPMLVYRNETKRTEVIDWNSLKPYVENNPKNVIKQCLSKMTESLLAESKKIPDYIA